MKVNKIINIIIILLILFGLIIIFKDVNFVDWTNSIKKSFQRTIIDEKRYELFIRGFNITILISFLSIIIGSLLGFVLFQCQRSNIAILKFLAKVIIRFLQGVPITVLLLTFYFVIFGKVNIDPVIVAIITFSIYFSAYVSEIFKGSFASINKNQIISAYSLGFTKIQTVRYIVIPQVLSYAIPVYKNECVSLIKLTSIAGYISVMELTKASDIVRNRTYEAFFPLIITALVYFIICYILCLLLDFIYKKINPRVVKA